jgi:plastocyanin
MSLALLRPLVPLLLAVGLLAACEGRSLDDLPSEVGVSRIVVQDNKFTPRVTQVPVGTEVTWAWEGSAPHDIAGDGFSSETMREGSFSHVFTATGKFDYVCRLHGGMTGRVIVTDPPRRFSD